jgi:hypothetical protein
MWIVYIIAIIIILSVCSKVFIKENSFFIILIPWLICLKHIGHHHSLSQYYSNFIEIGKTCLKIFCVFGPLIIAFILIFHIMMIKDDEANVEETIFQYIHTSSLKTINMMIGDLTIDDFSSKFTNIQWSFTFLIFTVLIAFILYNMTNALAVSDTERLNNEAHVFKVVSLAKQILLFQNIINNIALMCDLNQIFVPNIKDFTVNCNNYQWKIEKYSFEDLTYKKTHHQSLDYVDMRNTVFLQNSCFVLLDFNFAYTLKAITDKYCELNK